DVLADAGHPVGIAAGCGERHRREHLIRPPAHQHRVTGQQLLQRGLFGLGAEVLAGPHRGSPMTPSMDTRVDSMTFRMIMASLPWGCVPRRSPVPLRGGLVMLAAEAACRW